MMSAPFIFLWNPVIRHHADHVFAPVVVMEQGGVKAEIVQRHRLRPGTVYVPGRHQVILRIVHVAVKRLHHRVNQVKNPLVHG